MYRLPLIFLLVLGSFLGYGQVTLPNHVQLSFTYKPQASILPLQALFSFSQAKGSEKVQLTLINARVKGVNLVQSRVKEAIPFNYVNNQLTFKLPKEFSPGSQVLVSYQLDTSQLSVSPFYRGLPNGFALNALNYVDEESKGMGVTGFFYPAPNNKPLVLSLNISLPRKLSYRANGEVEFTAADGANHVYFTSTEKPIPAKDFYLLIGNFKAKDDAEDLEESLALSGSAKNKLFLNKIEQEIKPALTYYSAQTGFLFLEEDLLKLQSLDDFDTTNFFLKSSEVASSEISKPTFTLTKAAALLATQGDKNRASKMQYAFYVQRLGATWRDTFLQKRFTSGLPQNQFFWQEYLNSFLVKEGLNLSLADTSQLNDSLINLSPKNRSYLSLAQTIYHYQKPLPASVSFKYLGNQDELQLVFHNPDTALAFGFKVIIEYNLGKQDPVPTDSAWVNLKTNDTLRFPLMSSPRSVRLKVEPAAFIKLKQNRPLSYWLADLTQTENPQWQDEALDYLLENSSGNLFSTVMGIALDAPQSNLQLKALAKTEELNSMGRKKLEATIKALASEAKAPAVRQLAQQQLKLLYP